MGKCHFPTQFAKVSDSDLESTKATKNKGEEASG